MYLINNIFMWLAILLLVLMIIGLIIYVLPWALLAAAVVVPAVWVVEKVENWRDRREEK